MEHNKKLQNASKQHVLVYVFCCLVDQIGTFWHCQAKNNTFSTLQTPEHGSFSHTFYSKRIYEIFAKLSQKHHFYLVTT